MNTKEKVKLEYKKRLSMLEKTRRGRKRSNRFFIRIINVPYG
jgi:phage anti-repressor protein